MITLSLITLRGFLYIKNFNAAAKEKTNPGQDNPQVLWVKKGTKEWLRLGKNNLFLLLVFVLM
jgi:hypothetical protein